MGGWGLAFLSPRLRGVRVFAICVLGQSVGLGFRLRRRHSQSLQSFTCLPPNMRA